MIAASLPNNRIALDSDSVILAFYSAFCEALEAVLGRPAVAVVEQFNLQARFALSDEDHGKVWRHFESEGYWRKLEPMPGAREAIDDLVREGFEVHVVSGISERVMVDRLHNFSLFGFKPVSFHAVGHGRASKQAPVAQIQPLVFADDRVEHLHAAQFVPHLVLLTGEAPAEQYPVDGARVDAVADTLAEWTQAFLGNPRAVLAPRPQPLDLRAQFQAQPVWTPATARKMRPGA